MAFPPRIQKQIITDNLHIQEREISAVLEARRSHLSDLAAVLLSRSEEGSLSASALRGLASDAPLLDGGSMSLHREALESNRATLSAALTALSAYDRAMLATLLSDRLARQGRPLSFQTFLPPRAVSDKIAYVRNAYTDEAYDALSALLADPTALFCETYEESCECVASGEAGYCILPYRDAEKVRHRASLAMLHTHSLMLCALVTVKDGEDTPMEYALCGISPLAFSGAWELLLSLPGECGRRAGELTQTFALLGLTLTALSFEGEGREVLVSLRGSGDPTPLFVWLSLFVPAYSIGGFFHTTEEE